MAHSKTSPEAARAEDEERPPAKRLPVEAEEVSFKSAWSGAALGCAVSFVALGLAVAAKYGIVEQYAPRLSAGAFFGLFTSGGLALLLGLRKLPGRRGAAACLAALGWLPIVLVGVWFAQEPIVQSHWRCGTGDLGLLILVPCFIPLLGGASLLATVVRRPRFDVFVSTAAWTALAIVGVATAISLSWWRRPDPDTYVASLPTTTLAVGEALRLGDGTTLRYIGHADDSEVRRDAGVPAIVAAELAHDRDALPGDRLKAQAVTPPCSLEGVEGASLDCEPLTFRHDARLGLWAATGGPEHFAFLERERLVRDIQSADVASVIAPPLAWTMGGVVGFFLAGIALLRARRVTRNFANERGVEGSVDRAGWVALPDGPPVRLAGAEPGPVVLFMGRAETASYREARPRAVLCWQPGTRADADASVRARVTSLYAFAVTSALLCAAPLLMSGLAGAR